jgi:hypothetical protein
VIGGENATGSIGRTASAGTVFVDFPVLEGAVLAGAVLDGTVSEGAMLAAAASATAAGGVVTWLVGA